MTIDDIRLHHTYRGHAPNEAYTRRVDEVHGEEVRTSLRKGERLISSGVRMSRAKRVAWAAADVTGEVADGLA